MEKPRSRRPPDVDEALSSMLWTPYEQSDSSDSSTDMDLDERKAKRFSHPLPNSCIWWTGNGHVQNPVTMRYSFPYYGNYLPLSYPNNQSNAKNDNDMAAATTSNMVHSFTDEFLQYQRRSSEYQQHSLRNSSFTHSPVDSRSSSQTIMLNRSSKSFEAKNDNAAVPHSSFDARKSRRFNTTADESRRITYSGAPRTSISQERGIHDMRVSCNRSFVEASRRKSCIRHNTLNSLEGEQENFNIYFEKSYLSSPGKNYLNVRAGKSVNSFDKEKVSVKMRFNVPASDAGTTVVDITPECSSVPKVPKQESFLENGQSSSDVQIVSCLRAVSVQVADEWHLNNIVDNTSVNQIIHNHKINEINEINENNKRNDGEEEENVNLCVSASQKALQMDTVDLITSLPASSKMKYNSDPITTREQRRRERRERRQARTRGQISQSEYSMQSPPTTTSVIISDTSFQSPPDTTTVTSPPPYTTLPAPLVPSIVSTVPVTEDSRFSFPLNIVRRTTPSDRSKGCCGQWFRGPPLRFLVALVALGGVACTLGGATLGASGLVKSGPPTSHLTAGLLMTGVGIILVTISGVAWRMTTADAHQCTDFGRCGRRQCGRGSTSFGLLYPEFHHIQPPPSYSASMQEYRLRLLLIDRDRQAASNARRSPPSPPPTYNNFNAGTLLRPPLSNVRPNGLFGGISDMFNGASNSSQSNGNLNNLPPLNLPASTSSQTITIASINRISEPNFVRSSCTLINEREPGTYTKCTNIDNGSSSISNSSSFRSICNVDDCKNVNTQNTENKCIDNFS